MPEHRHAARRGGQSAYQEAQRPPMPTNASKFTAGVTIASQPIPKAKAANSVDTDCPRKARDEDEAGWLPSASSI